jgi:hypothetical protein
MAIWPFKSRPVVVPFRDDFTLRTFDFPCPVSQQQSNIVIPDNMFAIPVSVIVSLTLAGAAHATTMSYLCFYRDGRLIAHSYPALITVLNTYQLCWAPHGANSTVAASPLSWAIPMLFPVHLFPGDTVQFNQLNYLVTDTLLIFRLTAQVWEIY